MTRDEIVGAIEAVLRNRLSSARMVGFSAAARLNEDLYLDSVMMLELMLGIELDHGLSLPEESFGRQDLATVGDLADLYLENQAPIAAPARMQSPQLRFERAEQEAAERLGVHGEDYIDIKVHCVVSNLSHAVKRAGLDHRPFFFGVWDADFSVDDRWRLAYHAPGINHDFYWNWFTRLYGPQVRSWYRADQTKAENVETLLSLLKTKARSEFVIVMLDLFHLPERENKFNQNPFPHYLMLEETADETLFQVHDPDFRWEGQIEKEKVINAVMQPTVAGGYIFDSGEISCPSVEMLRDYFLACFREEETPFTSTVRDIVQAHLDQRDGVQLADLSLALRELPVLAIRKYAIEHGFAFFWRWLKLSNAEFDLICDDIEALIQELKSSHYSVLKLTETGKSTYATELFAKLDSAEAMEKRLKRRLAQVYRIWCDANGLAHVPNQRANAA